MTVRIHKVPLGPDNSYIVRGEGTILIDGGAPKKAGRFVSACEKLSLKPEAVGLIVLTHGHWDHIGSAAEIKEITGAKIAMHGEEKDCLEKSRMLTPPGVTVWGKLFMRIMALFLPLIHIPKSTVDVVLDDEERSLADYGISGRILSTPGHSKGSVSVLLNTGDAFVGDLAMSGFPLRFTPGLPILAENMEEVRKSWKRLLAKGTKHVYPAHGKPFSVDAIKNALF
ncbi:MAG: MBL fold metallo-hydrolase [Deltaproteobacteria bacterium]|jgi:glyoxylase-like metal-dependent hydrolase (beta-lactamase superfamily II)|nr:MBL fold metallo-hydrolase [Deltaproteobacteria bacterium]